MTELEAAILQALARIEALLRNSGQRRLYSSSTFYVDNLQNNPMKKPLDVHREALS